LTEKGQERLLNTAFFLSIITVVYNLGEGIISTYFGAHDETLALFGFGVDSFVEVISGLGVGHMIYRLKRHPVAERDRFERTALKITGAAFFLLTAGLIAGSVISVIQAAHPTTTVVGLIVSLVSIVTMWLLIHFKLKVGRALGDLKAAGSEAIISDAYCTRACLRLSFVLLASSALYELFRIPYIDVAGSLVIAYISFMEGREAFEKARNASLVCDDCNAENEA
jgi:divalent metal cation (Fe/Co/Zn/Cd) transporter